MDKAFNSEINIRRSYSADGFEIYIFNTLPNGKTYFAENVKFVEYDPGAQVMPTIRIAGNNAQGLMDVLWNEGFRPKNGVDNVGVVKAKDDHILDLQKFIDILVSKKDY